MRMAKVKITWAVLISKDHGQYNFSAFDWDPRQSMKSNQIKYCCDKANGTMISMFLTSYIQSSGSSHITGFTKTYKWIVYRSVIIICPKYSQPRCSSIGNYIRKMLGMEYWVWRIMSYEVTQAKEASKKFVSFPFQGILQWGNL